MKILALDPAEHCGWALSRFISGTWDFKIKRDESTGMRYFRFRAKMSEICEKEGIELIAYERPAGQHKTDIISHSKFVGIIEEYCISNNIDYKGYSPSEIKMFATGKGNANKDMMVEAARKRLKYNGSDKDEADALWVLELVKDDLNLL